MHLLLCSWFDLFHPRELMSFSNLFCFHFVQCSCWSSFSIHSDLYFFLKKLLLEVERGFQPFFQHSLLLCYQSSNISGIVSASTICEMSKDLSKVWISFHALFWFSVPDAALEFSYIRVAWQLSLEKCTLSTADKFNSFHIVITFYLLDTMK